MNSIKLNIIDSMPLHIVFCVGGKSFSGNFLDSFFYLMDYCYSNRITFTYIRRYNPVVYFMRNLCLGGDVLRGKHQKPFNGQLNYTHIMWIDEDIIFKPQQFLALLNLNRDIVSGVYMTRDRVHYASVKVWNEEYFKKNGTFEFLSEEDLKDHKGLMEVDYTGFGFMLIKKGVFESLSYPWFRPLFYDLGTCVDFTAEDVGFCRLIKQKGYKVYIDPRIRVGHIKETVI